MGISKKCLAQILNSYKCNNEPPFVVEVLGTPNAGKTSAIQTFEKILKRNKIKHKIIYEAASRCKIQNKLSPDFNLWTLNETAKQLLEAYSGNYDIVICERGLLDALCWCELYFLDKMLAEDEYQKITDYILLNRLIGRINCYYVIECSIETSIERENTSGLLDASGTIVNEVVLAKYNCSLKAMTERYRHSLNIISLDTTHMTQTDINKQFAITILKILKNCDNFL